jgi:hypothetical protein
MTHDERQEFGELEDALLEWAENSDLVRFQEVFARQAATLLFEELLSIKVKEPTNA